MLGAECYLKCRHILWRGIWTTLLAWSYGTEVRFLSILMARCVQVR